MTADSRNNLGSQTIPASRSNSFLHRATSSNIARHHLGERGASRITDMITLNFEEKIIAIMMDVNR